MAVTNVTEVANNTATAGKGKKAAKAAVSLPSLCIRTHKSDLITTQAKATKAAKTADAKANATAATGDTAKADKAAGVAELVESLTGLKLGGLVKRQGKAGAKGGKAAGKAAAAGAVSLFSFSAGSELQINLD